MDKLTPQQEEQVRKIANEVMMANYNDGSPFIPPHSHNSTDNLPVSPVDLVGFGPIPTGGNYKNQTTGRYESGFGGSLSPASNGHEAQSIADPTLAIYPIPIVIGNGVGPQSAFNGGWAPDGTLVYFANGTTLNGLYIRFNDQWYGVNLPLTA